MNKVRISLYFLLAFCLTYALFGRSAGESVEELIRHAGLLGWDSRKRGRPALFRRGLDALEKAEALIENLEPEQQEQTKRQDRWAQAGSARTNGNGPRYFVGSFPSPSFCSLRKTEWFDDPKVMSTSRATIGLRDTLIENWRTLPQMGVTFAAFENTAEERSRSYALENETAYLINENPKFFNHNSLEIESALTPKQAEEFYSMA